MDRGGRPRDDGSRPGDAEIDRLETARLGPGQALAMASADIHSVDNSGAAVSYTLHVYGRNLATAGRRQYDPEAKTVRAIADDLA